MWASGNITVSSLVGQMAAGSAPDIHTICKPLSAVLMVVSHSNELPKRSLCQGCFPSKQHDSHAKDDILLELYWTLEGCSAYPGG